MKMYLVLAVLGINLSVFAQQKTIEGYELGIDGFVSASNQGGAFGLGPKFGFRLNDNLILGPSFRWQKTWNSAFSQTFNYSIWGGGAFLHARYKNVVFGGFEIEMLKVLSATLQLPRQQIGFQLSLFVVDSRKNGIILSV
jgi:hypothetical protein